MPEQALRQTEESTDYELNEDYTSCWVTIENISVYILRTSDGVSVDLFACGEEDKTPIASTYATFLDASEDN